MRETNWERDELRRLQSETIAKLTTEVQANHDAILVIQTKAAIVASMFGLPAGIVGAIIVAFAKSALHL